MNDTIVRKEGRKNKEEKNEGVDTNVKAAARGFGGRRPATFKSLILQHKN